MLIQVIYFEWLFCVYGIKIEDIYAKMFCTFHIDRDGCFLRQNFPSFNKVGTFSGKLSVHNMMEMFPAQHNMETFIKNPPPSSHPPPHPIPSLPFPSAHVVPNKCPQVVNQCYVIVSTRLYL